MPFLPEWDENNVNKLKYNLNDENPIYISSHKYTDKSMCFFDMHYELEVGILRSGRVIRKYHNYETELIPGQVWLGGVWEPHGFNIIEAPCEMTVFMIYPELLAKMDQPGFKWMKLFSLPPENRPQIKNADSQDVLGICENIQKTERCIKQTKLIWDKLLLSQTLLYLIDGEENLFSSESDMEVRQYADLQPCMQLIYNSHKLISIETAAKACSLSPSQFSKLFRRLMGLPFSKFALRYRINEAACELRETDEPIKYIAVKWGFTDTSHFNHCFNDHYAVSPKEYRELHRKGISIQL